MFFFVSGGFPMVFVVVFGAVALLAAIRFALDPVRGSLRPIVAYGLAVALMSVAGFAVDLRFATAAAARFEDPDERLAVALQGLSESLAPPILGFALLAVVALICGVGLRRRSAG
jgi:hypothetical protein